ncbi:SecD/SecF fusion protein [Deinobacterium chartae]|uniref:Multifunctional fusion protein n=1 Tax=Deinobacterium chartae TaxID=521158 RepID=A0A841HZV0_9DEIO|nr:protein translocase subunit SecD [Deinobacterium chartae]MBB6097730.1 SecD/SecF fusion protein [Deinobacterium chartae]
MSYSDRNRRKKRPAPKGSSPYTVLLLVAVLIAAVLGVLRPWQHPSQPLALWTDNYKFLNLGLDLQGGLRVTLQVDEKNPEREDVEKAKTIIENRVNALGVAEPTVQIQGNDRVIVELPGLKEADQERALRLIGQTAKLEFRIVNPGVPAKELSQYTLADLGPALATGEVIANAQAETDSFGRWVVAFQTSPAGREPFGKLTRDNVGRGMAIVLDGQIKSIATIQAALPNGGQITGDFDAKEASDLALVLKSGSLPVPLKQTEVRQIGPTLGADAIRTGAMASLLGIALIFVMAFAYYGLYFGLVIGLGLLFTTLIMLGILGGLGATLTLPGIAGLVLTLGAAVDGNVISFERIKEELRRGKGIKGSIGAGFSHSTVTILDVNLSHLLSALALYNYSSGPVKGFAVTLAVGVIAAVFSNLIFSRWMLEAMARRRDYSAPQWFATPKLDFIRLSPIVTTVSVALAILGGVLVATRGLQYGIDFTAGTALTLYTDRSVSVDDVRTAVGAAGIEGVEGGKAVIQQAASSNPQKNQYIVKVAELPPAQVQQLSTSLEGKLAGGDVQQTETIGPAVGQELRVNTIKAVALALVLILIYVWFRFDMIFGIASVLATVHAVGIVMGVYSLFNLEFNIAAVAAVLTVIGYALNDAIIVSDRIRENLKLMRGSAYKDIVNASINQTLSRTVMTSVSTALPLISLTFLGGSVLRDFGLIMLIGVIVGTYSSIYIVAPMVAFYQNWATNRRKAKPAKAA